MRALRRRLTQLRDDESGLSLAEVLVAMMLTMIILVMVTSMFIQTAKLTTAANQTRDSNGNATNVANEITAVTRVATNLAKLNSATPDTAIIDGSNGTTLIIYSLSNTSPTDPAPVKVTFTLDTTAHTVTEVRCVGTLSGSYYTFGTCASTSTRVIGTGVLTPTGVTDQLFVYNDVNRLPMTISGGKLDAGQRALVASITVNVRTQPANSSTHVVVVSNTVVLRNIGLDTGS